jgi:DNA-binding GntR family transcriptional regulator
VLARDLAAAQKMLAAHLHSTIDFVYPQASGEQS